MDHAHAGTEFLTLAIVLLGAAVLSVPIARRLGLSAIVAYLIAGIAIGPYGLGLIRETGTILTVAELGVVMLLFIIGLELQVSRLIAMSRAIFGLGAAQLTLTAALIALSAYGFGFLDWRASLLAGLALALSATAIALQILEERGHMQRTYGQRAFAILLFQDMSVVPLLALVPLLAPGGDTTSFADTSLAVVKIAVAIGLLIAAGRYLLNPFFHLLASTGAREAMTAAALLVVLGAALLMQVSGMSMALGAFLAGLLLAESNYRHELEADIEPFRGLLLALFFMGIGMSLDLGVVLANLALVIGAAMIISLLKAAIVWGLFQATCADPDDPLRAGSILTSASEFAFVLLPLGASLGVLTPAQGSLLTAIAAITMFMGPPLASATDWALRRRKKPVAPDALDELEEARGSVILIGFGRFGQLASQLMLAEGIDITAIDNNAQRIQDAGNFGFKVFFGDGARLEVLRAAATKEVRLIAICIDDRAATNRIVELIQAEFPGVKIFARAYDRGHTLELLDKGVDYEIRELYESAIVYGRSALEALGFDEEQARNVEADIRRRDAERLALQQAEGIYAGRDLVHTQPVPQPLNQPRRTGRALNPEARDIIDHETEFSG